MNTFSTTSRRLALTALALISIGVFVPDTQAQTFVGKPTLSQSPTGLRIYVAPIANSTKVHIRYENDGFGTVRVQIRNERGSLVYDEVEVKRKHAAIYDLAALSPGIYSVELRSRSVRHTRYMRIEAPVKNQIALLDVNPANKSLSQSASQPASSQEP